MNFWTRVSRIILKNRYLILILIAIAVYKDDLDNIIGILYVKDLLPFLDKKESLSAFKTSTGVCYGFQKAR